ncbi:MAG: ribosomal RNA small subunit methyltransferase A [Spirochaetes bacterium GWF1_31_7]|nr:MAG: ribosomal RNA small subunit methyltransferase A [Spirochaetes bacterium GWE1_32_154]OHD48363.1 MAG: ribosomal RNA small subunit methyltransferase A [Spirochaetes bacterium GWF1_31_7]OHD50456.1 MAG: ribosomal RNA small subunit methyltransferase A [Spirochaetes bacterium GWE2_31_10]OHD81594.1 MAG: ribosomal RNA small subunit methyltransferase A [Spirochaetes bacterium RIFOXYB1_FULL_32_8]HBD96366.1 ribosomal RNA small subunit methyltransferase A [Spirochaetia bacterium]
MEFKYYSVKEILNFIEENHLSINKKFGQNFLINSGVCDTIVKSLEIKENDVVFEIGCGLGSLTNRLIESGCKRLVGFEIDRAYIKHIKTLFAGYDNFNLIEGDFLKTFEDAMKQYVGPDDNLIITGNLPYYITTPILEKIFTSDLNISKAAFMMQKEVAERIISPPGTKKYGSLTIFCNFHSDPKIVAKISPSSFHPRPNVDSSVVRFTIVKDKYPVKDKTLFFKVSRSLFINRRKQLRNNLMNSPFLKDLEQVDLVALLEKSGISPNDRGEILSIPQICELTDNIFEFVKSQK